MYASLWAFSHRWHLKSSKISIEKWILCVRITHFVSQLCYKCLVSKNAAASNNTVWHYHSQLNTKKKCSKTQSSMILLFFFFHSEHIAECQNGADVVHFTKRTSSAFIICHLLLLYSYLRQFRFNARWINETKINCEKLHLILLIEKNWLNSIFRYVSNF